MNETVKQPRADRLKEGEEKGFADFMARAETKLMLSMIPPSDNPDVMATLLRGAFNAGAGAGSGSVIIELMNAMLLDKPQRRTE